MAMTFEFNIRPFGYQNDPIQFGRMRVHSAGSRHEYSVEYKAKDGWETIRGSIAKTQEDGTKRSGHRNFLHLLTNIMDDIDFDELGQNYVHVLSEIEEVCPWVKEHGANVGDYRDE